MAAAPVPSISMDAIPGPNKMIRTNDLSPAQPVVSVITPNWNCAKFLAATYQSLCEQTFEPWEWIVADDGSTDDSLAVLTGIHSRDPRVRILPLKHSGLPAVARNAALRTAKGEFLAFLDADDLFLPQKLERQVEFLRQNPSIGVTYSHIEEFWSDGDQSGSPAPVVWARIDLPSEAFSSLLRYGNVLCTSSILIRREVYERTGPIDEGADLRAMEDHDYILRISRNWRIQRTPGVWTRYRIHRDNVSKTNTFARFEAVKNRLEARGDLNGPGAAEFLSGFYLARAEMRMSQGEKGSAIRADALLSVRQCPRMYQRWLAAAALFLPDALRPGVYRALKRIQARLQGKRASPHFLTKV